MAKKKSIEFKRISKIEFLPTGVFMLDRSFPGWPKTKFSILAGFPGTGKTTIALSTAQVALSQNIPVFYIDAEYGLDLDWMQKIVKSEIEVIRDISLEEAFSLMAELVKRECLIIVDSFPALRPENDESYGYRAKYLSQNIPPLLSIMQESKALILGLNQVRQDFTSRNIIIPGGFALLHYASVILELNLFRKQYSNNEVVGLDIQFHAEKLKHGNVKVLPRGIFSISFQEGINPSAELRQLVIDLGIVEEKAGMFYLGEQQFTERTLLNYIKNNREEIIQLIKERLYEQEKSQSQEN